MLNQPTNIVPSSFAGSGAGVVAAASNVYVSWQVNGNSPMTSVKIDVYTNDAASTLVHTTGAVSTITTEYPNGFNGKDEKGNVVYFEYPASIGGSAVTWSTWGLTDGNEYKLKITQYWNNNTESVEQYAESVFITRSLPSLSLASFTNPVDTVSKTFTATYTQTQNDALDWVRWQFAAIGDDFNIIDDTGEINTGVLSYTYDGLLNGGNYAIKCTVSTQNGVVVNTGWQTFSVEYTESTTQGEITAQCGDGCAYVSWGQATNIPATSASGNSFAYGYLSLILGGTVEWTTVDGSAMDIPSGWTFGWRAYTNGIGETNYSKVVLSNDIEIWGVEVNGVKKIAFLSAGEREEITVPDSAGVIDVYLTPTKAIAYFYADSGMEYISGAEINLSYTQSAISSVLLRGMQNCIFIVASSQINVQPNLTPTWNGNTYFLSSFSEETLNIGTYSDTAGTFSHAIYRGDGNQLVKLVNIPTSITAMRDYSTRAQTQYYYEMFYSDSVYSVPVISEGVCQRTRGYYLLETTEDENGVYHVLNAYRFNNKLNVSGISNNNNPNFLATFTPYRVRQQSSRMGKTGTLTALISNFENGVYSDNTALMNKLYNLSITEHTLFLKDMKGDIYKIGISGAITQTVNTKSRLQEVTISIPFEEIGDASDAVIIQLPTDEGWNA